MTLRPLLALLAFAVPALAETPVLEEKAKIPLASVKGRLDHMALTADGKRLYVAALGNNSLEVVNLEERRREASVGGFPEVQGVVVVASSVLVSTGGDGGVRRCNLAGQPGETRISGLDDADNLRVDPVTGHVFVGYGDGALAEVDGSKPEKVGETKLDGHPESFQLEAKGDRAFVNVPARAEVEVVDRRKREVIARWKLDGAEANFPMALDEAGHRLFVGCRRPARVIVLDTESGKQVSTLEAPGDADDIYWDAPSRRLFVSGGDGTVAVFAKGDGDRFERTALVHTRAGARTSLLSPDGTTLYVALPARDGQDAEIRVYAVAPPGK